jgi:uncharacterized membrane protein YraQ (UPF0718 family)
MLLKGVLFQLEQIAFYWIAGLLMGSLASVYLSEKIVSKMAGLKPGGFSLWAVCAASLLGIVSPLCMYGTVPLIAALGRKKVPGHALAAFMMGSILLNPNLFFVSFALGTNIALIRLFLSFIAGTLAGFLMYLLFRKKEFFRFERFGETGAKKGKTFSRDLAKAFRITFPYLLFGVFITAVFDRYVPPEWVSGLFGTRQGLGVLFAATLSIPLYACGGGTVPLILAWMRAGMGQGDAFRRVSRDYLYRRGFHNMESDKKARQDKRISMKAGRI